MRHLGCYKKAIFWVVFSSIIFLSNHSINAEIGQWKVTKSSHFYIYYQKAFPEYIRRVAREAEANYGNITEYLGFNRFDFWTWDNRCKIYLYENQRDYQSRTGVASWSRGNVNVIKKEISTYVWQEEFFEAILPHEMGHIIFREFVGFNKDAVPLWLDEGVACSQEKNIKERLRVAKFLVNLNLYIPLEDFSNINKVDLIMPFIFYSEAASVADFMLERFGRETFVNFCRRLSNDNKIGWKEALLSTYKLKNLQELEEKWVDYCKTSEDKDK